jgi:hypothetical protein
VVTRDVEEIVNRPISVREFFECHKHLFTGKAAEAA